jgi:glutathione S-transferase
MKAYRLHYFPESGNSYKLALMLALCEQPFEAVWTDYFGGVTRTAHWRTTVNEMGEVPVLEDGPERLTQSGAILIRLAKRHGLFLPDHESARHEVLRWLLWDNHKLTSYMATYRLSCPFSIGLCENSRPDFLFPVDGADAGMRGGGRALSDG